MKNFFKYLPILLIAIFSTIGVSISQNKTTKESELLKEIESFTQENVTEIVLVKVEDKVEIKDVLTENNGYLSNQRLIELNRKLEGTLRSTGPTP